MSCNSSFQRPGTLKRTMIRQTKLPKLSLSISAWLALMGIRWAGKIAKLPKWGDVSGYMGKHTHTHKDKTRQSLSGSLGETTRCYRWGVWGGSKQRANQTASTTDAVLFVFGTRWPRRAESTGTHTTERCPLWCQKVMRWSKWRRFRRGFSDWTATVTVTEDSRTAGPLCDYLLFFFFTA